VVPVSSTSGASGIAVRSVTTKEFPRIDVISSVLWELRVAIIIDELSFTSPSTASAKKAENFGTIPVLDSYRK